MIRSLWMVRGLGACVASLVALCLTLHYDLRLDPFDLASVGAEAGETCEKPGQELQWEKPTKEDYFGTAGKELIKELKASRIEAELKFQASKANVGGTKDDHEQAEYLHDLWSQQGLDEVHMTPYELQFSHPDPEKPNKVYLLDENDNVKFTSTILEEPIDSQEYDDSIPHGFLAFAPAGTIVTKELVYANYGQFDDFEELLRQGIDVRGRVVIIRLARTFRGDKVLNAERFGAAGVILYTDPSDYHPDTEAGIPAYPKSIWLPGTGIQRGTLLWHDGDPTTPNYPAIDGAYRVPENRTDVPKIPAHVLSYNDARKLLAVIGGPKAPQEWQGRLNVTYNLGPHLAREGWSVKLEVNNKKRMATTYNVIGLIRGSEEPDRYVIYGNHRDSWTFGSCDPSSGTATMVEIIRGYGKLMEKGWRPRRSMVFISLGAGEYSFFGAIEWIEEYLKVFESRAVAFMNVDIAMMYNYNLIISATPLMYKIITAATKEIPAPDPSLGYSTLWDHYSSRVRQSSPDLYDVKLGSISEHGPFHQRLGVPTSYMVWYINFEDSNWSDYPLYHSTYDDFNFVKTYLDPDFSYHLALARLWALTGLGLADNPVLPMDPEDESEVLRKIFVELKEEYGDALKAKDISLAHLEKYIEKFTEAAKDFKVRLEEVENISPLKARQLSDQLMQLEKCYLDDEGLPQRPHMKNLIFGTDNFNQYNNWMLPGLRDALWSATHCRGLQVATMREILSPASCEMYWDQVKQQLGAVIYAIHSATLMIKDPKGF
ncbi:putative N-acetylated-alpha-linked acidic dipeptidase [Oratosquilla oratoria]|uniref:putative N-acetylated-alpha-linked acidic dipeptidase n=1 Tax=Oratosquilla oratoria TaxID=337810 RepID=UPI003F771787